MLSDANPQGMKTRLELLCRTGLRVRFTTRFVVFPALGFGLLQLGKLIWRQDRLDLGPVRLAQGPALLFLLFWSQCCS